ncbi:hypothetical protein ASD65_13910 [Microbacterium sp. Root61]|uniref:aldehyde dehydrogenase family protein n=1 Tax=Microbacterium sp. Root61 TaxID=1736570 RepID=UPI0006FD4DCC|nr:aldehyde dehydrogenase family protein [Microbacterium sp. Root61]KRA25397.1 hypothetical protein ASD65_13910 [Microbacterium sp. Root61]
MTQRDDASPSGDLLGQALAALRTRESWSAFTGAVPEGPTWDEAVAEFTTLQGSTLELVGHPGIPTLQTDEVSPYTREPLRISYPRARVEELLDAAQQASPSLARLDPETRIALCVAIIERLFAQNNLLGVAAMHTTGQGRGMSLSGSGTNALDRGLEAVAMAHEALSRAPRTAEWTGVFGDATVALEKSYRLVPLGTAAVVACASFPAWNVYPAVLANLATGNPVVLKPHPSSVLQMALAVRTMREVLVAYGVDADAVLLATDSMETPNTQELVTAPRTRIVDFTGSAGFGSWIEANATQARVYTETSGVNAVVIDSFEDEGRSIRAIAGAVGLFSAQMCTAPQNIYVPETGIRTADGILSPDEFAQRLTAAISDIADAPRRAGAVMGAIQSDRTVTDVAALAGSLGDAVVRPAVPYPHADFPAARTLTPLVAFIDQDDQERRGGECFGPVVFLIRTPDARAGLQQATSDARTHGAISAFLYSTDEDLIDDAIDAYAEAGAALTINVTGAMPINFSAAFSDFHVSGLNPAGNATLTDESFIAGRYRITQSRRPARNSKGPVLK